MTRTLAAKVIDGFHSQGWTPIGRGGTWAGAMRPLEEYVKRKVEKAVAAEREACAKVCDGVHAHRIAEYGDYLGESYATTCAAAIRARGAK